MAIPTIQCNQELLDYLSQGGRAEFFFFWGHQPEKNGSIGPSCLSQWFCAPFELDGNRYMTAEHYMMAEKARLFGDADTLNRILSSLDPGEVKKLGRKIENFDEYLWLRHRFAIVVRGNLAKFSQNEILASYLLATGERILVEASPMDRIWGIGLVKKHSDAQYPEKWKGLNLLGYALMQVRDSLMLSSHFIDKGP